MTREQIIETVKDYILQQWLPGEDPRNLTPTTELITSGILDSLATLELVSFLEEKYKIELQAHEVDASRIGSLAAIADMVLAKQGAKV